MSDRLGHFKQTCELLEINAPRAQVRGWHYHNLVGIINYGIENIPRRGYWFIETKQKFNKSVFYARSHKKMINFITNPVFHKYAFKHWDKKMYFSVVKHDQFWNRIGYYPRWEHNYEWHQIMGNKEQTHKIPR